MRFWGFPTTNISQLKEGGEALKKAYELQDRASQREKFYIMGHYYDLYALDSGKRAGSVHPMDTNLSTRYLSTRQ